MASRSNDDVARVSSVPSGSFNSINVVSLTPSTLPTRTPISAPAAAVRVPAFPEPLPKNISADAETGRTSCALAPKREEAAQNRDRGQRATSKQPNQRNGIRKHRKEEAEDQDRCRHCHSSALRVDWKEGDKVCTDCGVVDEERLRDDRPEWKDFCEAEDLVKGMPASARSGLVPVDESKYVGGLQPTILSEHPYGGTGGNFQQNNDGYGQARLRKRLVATNRKLDRMMHKMHASALRDAEINRAIRNRRLGKRQGDLGDDTQDDETVDENSSIRPDYDKLQLEVAAEEDAHRLQAALFAEKWSLDRAIFLHGSEHERATSGHAEGEENPRDLMRKMSSTLQAASGDMYQAYSILLHVAHALQLPQRVVDETAKRLERYAIQRDGLAVKGVSSRLSKSNRMESQAQHKLATSRLRMFNQTKQMATLVAALLFLTTRYLGWTRTATEICTSIKGATLGDKNTETDGLVKEALSLKLKHVSRALSEVKAAFPDMVGYSLTERLAEEPQLATKAQVGSSIDQICAVVSNFAEETLRRLELPSLAEDCVCSIVVHCRRRQLENGEFASARLATICASTAHFISQAGSIMQRLARHGGDNHTPSEVLPRKRKSTNFSSSSLPPGPSKIKRSKLTGAIRFVTHSSAQSPRGVILMDGTPTNVACPSKCSKSFKIVDDFGVGDDDDDDDEAGDKNSIPFDVFSHKAIPHDSSETTRYEMSRMWDAWIEQLPWLRSVSTLEQTCGVSGKIIMEFYKEELYPKRLELLHLLKQASQSLSGALRDSPMAPLLLSHIDVVAPLMAVEKGR